MIKKWMKEALLIFSAVLTGLIVLGMHCAAATNEYNGEYYGGSMEELEELERRLEDDPGWVCLNDYPDIKETLKADYDYLYFGYVANVTCHIWYDKEAFGDYVQNGDRDGISRGDNIIIVDYLTFLTGTEEGNITGASGADALMSGVPTGTVIIKGLVDEEMRDNRLAVANIILYGHDLDAYYEIQLNGGTDWINATNIPADDYTIYSAFLDVNYPAAYANRIYHVGVGSNEPIEITFGMIDRSEYIERTLKDRAENIVVNEPAVEAIPVNRTKYVVFGVLAVVMCVITILMIRFLNNYRYNHSDF